MRKLVYVLIGFVAAAPFVLPTLAAVNVTTAPTSSVASPVEIKATSAPLEVLKFSLSADAGETLTSVKVTIDNAAGSAAVGADVSAITVYRDDGDGVFEASADVVAGTETSASIGSATSVAITAGNALPATYFVALATSGSWSDLPPPDSVSITFTADGIVTSANSPTVVSVTTSTITADTTGPALTSVVAKDTGSNAGLGVGDSVEFTFNGATNKPVLSPAQLAASLTLSGSHSFLDGNGLFQGMVWSADGTKLTLSLSGNVSLPSVVVGDTVTVQGALITDAVGNSATGSVSLTGSFSTADTTGPVLISAQAKDVAATAGKTAGDTIELTFGEATNKPSLTKDNINAVLVLSNGHSFLDGSANLGSASWNAAGTILTIGLSAATSLPAVALGDSVSAQGTVIKDVAGNNATGSQVIGGSFGDDSGTVACGNGVINGRLYRLVGNGTLYLAASCELKVFNGQAADHARGKKFKNIIALSSLIGHHSDDDDCDEKEKNHGQNRGQDSSDDEDDD